MMVALAPVRTPESKRRPSTPAATRLSGVHTKSAAGSSGVIEIPAAGTRLFLEKGILVDFDLEDVVGISHQAEKLTELLEDELS